MADKIETEPKKRKRQAAKPGRNLTANTRYGPKIIQSTGRTWNQAAEAIFLEQLASTCNVRLAANEAGLERTAVYRQRMKNPAFAERWQAALEQGYARLEMLLVKTAEDALAGVEIDPKDPITPMTIKEAMTVLQLHRASVKGGEGTRHSHNMRLHDAETARVNILKKVETVRSARGYQ